MTNVMRDIPLSKLVRSEKNVRRTGRDNGLDELATSIAAHGLLQSLSVAPVLDETGAETGKFSVSGGGRRFDALKLLVKRKQIGKGHAVPCLIHGGEAGEASLAENVVREPLHPADQFEAFRVLAEERGHGAEEIAARFGVTAHIVKQRLRLGNVSPRLMELYRDGELALDQLKAFALTDDHIRQEHVFDSLSYNRDPSYIRRELTRSHVACSDRRALFVGAEVYEEAGGVIMRDLFSESGSGYFQDVALLEQLALDKLQGLADQIRESEGWKWASAHLDYPGGHGMRRTYPQSVDLSEEDKAAYDAAQTEYGALNAQYDSAEELPDEVDARLGELEAEIERLDAKCQAYDADAIARGGVFVVLNYDGSARIERGFIRAEDEAPEIEDEPESGIAGDEFIEGGATMPEAGDECAVEDMEGDALKPISDTLTRELSAHRTQALRLTLSEQPNVALFALTHTLAAQVFYRSVDATCLDIRASSAYLGNHASGIDDTAPAKTLSDRHEAWAARMPQRVAELWEFIAALDPQELIALLAHCAALSANALKLAWERKPVAHQTVEQLATKTELDMSAHWSADVDSYFGNITKAHILAAVREAVHDEAADRIAHLKRPEMAEAAAELVLGTGWLPQPLRTIRPSSPEPVETVSTDTDQLMLDAAE